MFFRIHNKIVNIQRTNYNTDEEFYEAIILLKYKKIFNGENTVDKIFSMV